MESSQKKFTETTAFWVLVIVGILIVIVGSLVWWGYEATKTPLEKETSCISPKIKGNISQSGEKIYHNPEDEYYSRTEIDESNGERMFCTEDEAKDAGWRHSKV